MIRIFSPGIANHPLNTGFTPELVMILVMSVVVRQEPVVQVKLQDSELTTSK
jgi:hypothetical protein